jgi:hypothetical protein
VKRHELQRRDQPYLVFLRIAEVYEAAMAEAGYPAKPSHAEAEVDAPQEIVNRAMRIALESAGIPGDTWIDALETM